MSFISDRSSEINLRWSHPICSYELKLFIPSPDNDTSPFWMTLLDLYITCYLYQGHSFSSDTPWRPSSHMLVPHPGHLVCNTILDWHGNKPSNGRQKTHYTACVKVQKWVCRLEYVLWNYFSMVLHGRCAAHTHTLSHTQPRTKSTSLLVQ